MTADVRRDRWGRYLVRPPAGGSPVGYTRATTVAKTLDSEGGLILWKATMAITGMKRRPGLAARWDALLAAHDSPWYSDAKNECRKLVEECAEAGGSADRAEIGTALHAMAELVDLGTPITVATPSISADLDAYKATIVAAGIRFDAAGVEACVVLDDYQVAGTADRLITHLPGYALPLVADLKTGADLKYGWQAIAVQLAIYAHADNIYRQGEAADGFQDERLPMPQVDQEQALVIHLPAGESRCELHLVDIAAGWEAFQRSMWVRSWRNRRDLARPMLVERVAAPSIAAGTAGSPSAVPATIATQRDQFTAVQRERIVARIRRLADQADTFMFALSNRWPSGVPTFKSGHTHSLDELALIAAAVTVAAADVAAPFGADDVPPASPKLLWGEAPPAPPTDDPLAGCEGVNTTSIMGGEGGAPAAPADPFVGLNGEPVDYATPEICQGLIDRLQQLEPDTLATITRQLKRVGVPNLRSGRATYLHVEMVAEALDRIEHPIPAA